MPGSTNSSAAWISPAVFPPRQDGRSADPALALPTSELPAQPYLPSTPASFALVSSRTTDSYQGQQCKPPGAGSVPQSVTSSSPRSGEYIKSPKFCSSCFYKNTSHSGVVPPPLCTMKERVSSYSDRENCPKNHLHTACSHLGAAAAPSDTPQQFPSHKAVLGTQVHLLMSLLTALAPQLSQRDAASVPRGGEASPSSPAACSVPVRDRHPTGGMRSWNTSQQNIFLETTAYRAASTSVSVQEGFGDRGERFSFPQTTPLVAQTSLAAL